MENRVCPDCKGNGLAGCITMMPDGDDFYDDCPTCHGEGEITGELRGGGVNMGIIIDEEGLATWKCTCGGEVKPIVGETSTGIEYERGRVCSRCGATSHAVMGEPY